MNDVHATEFGAAQDAYDRAIALGDLRSAREAVRGMIMLSPSRWGLRELAQERARLDEAILRESGALGRVLAWFGTRRKAGVEVKVHGL